MTHPAHSLFLDAIVIGERVRKDMGDIDALADSMKRHGLLHPVVVKRDRTLVAGHRRIEAARRLGWKEIPVTMIEVDDMLAAERDENTERKDFTPSEAVAIGRLIEERHKARIAEKRHEVAVEAGKKRQGLLTSMSKQPLGATRLVAAAAVGMGATTYEKAKDIVDAAESDHEKFGDLPAKMDETGNVNGTHRELERRRSGNFNGSGKRGFRKDKSAPFEIKTKRHRLLAAAAKERMVRSLSIVTGHCRGLDELDVPMVLAACSAEEISEWVGKAREAGRAFFKLAGKLKEGMKHEH